MDSTTCSAKGRPVSAKVNPSLRPRRTIISPSQSGIEIAEQFAQNKDDCVKVLLKPFRRGSKFPTCSSGKLETCGHACGPFDSSSCKAPAEDRYHFQRQIFVQSHSPTGVILKE